MTKGIRVLLLICILQLQAFGACEAEYEEAKEYEGKCNTAKDITTGCGIAAVATVMFHFGIGGAFCAAPALSASEICKLKDQRRDRYYACTAEAAENQRQEAVQNEDKLRRKREAKAQATRKYYDGVLAYQKEVRDLGPDPDEEDISEELYQRFDQLEATYETELKEIEDNFS